MATIPFFDTKECEWSDVKVQIAGANVTKLRGISYKATKDKELLYSTGDSPVSVQSGNRAYEGQIKLLKGALDDLNRAAIAAGGEDVLDLAFDIVITYRQKGSRAMQIDTLIGVQVKEFEKAMEQGAKFMDVTLPIVFLTKKIN